MAWTRKRAADGSISREEFKAAARERRFKPVTVFFGEEDLLISRAEQFMRSALLGGDVNDFNCELYYCEKDDGSMIASAAATAPFGGGNKLVIARNAGELKDDSYPPFEKFAVKPPKGAYLLMLYPGKSTWGPKNSGNGIASFRKAMAKSGMVVEFAAMDKRELERFVLAEASKMGIQVSGEAVALLAEETGNELGILLGTLEQASMFNQGRKIGEAEIRSLIISTRGYSTFALAAALGEKRLGEALAMAEPMFRNESEIIGNLRIIARHFRILAKVRDMLDRRCPMSEIQRETGVGEYHLGREYTPQARTFTAERLAQSLVHVTQADYEIRTSKMSKSKVVERLFIRLCS
ncbi:MAG: DNA polymerase III subunit delta [Myxococcota bacterium]|jgi:DNA polymerase-3 subunit delta